MDDKERARKLIDALTLAVDVDINLTGDIEQRIEIVDAEALIAAAVAEVKSDTLNNAESAAFEVLTRHGFTGARYCIIAAIRRLIDTFPETVAPDPTKTTFRDRTVVNSVYEIEIDGQNIKTTKHGLGVLLGTEARVLPTAPDPTKALARLFAAWWKEQEVALTRGTGIPISFDMICKSGLFGSGTMKWELTDLGRAALCLADDGG